MSVIYLSQELEKLKSVAAEKQSLFLFNVLSTQYQNLALLDATLIIAQSSTLLEGLIIALRSPGLNRAHRNLLGRCFVTTFRRIDRGPFETTTKILALLQREKDEKYKWNAIVVLGIIFENIGDQIVSLVPELVNVLGRLTKSSAGGPGIRAAAFNAIGAALSKTAKLDDASYRDVLKYLKNCLPDKSAVVYTAAYDCLNELIICGSNHNEESLQNMILKNVEQITFKTVRSAASRCLASFYLKVLLTSHTDEESEASHVELMYRNLSTLYNKTLYRQVRSIVAVTYQEILYRMGAAWITQYHEQTMISVLNDLQLTVPQTDRHRMLMTRRHVKILLRQIGDALDQEAQVVAINRMLAHIRTAPSRHILVPCLMEITRLVRTLGSATPSDIEFDPIFFLMSHPVHSVQVATAMTMKTIVLNVPSLLSNMVTNVFTRLKDELSTFSDADGTARNLDCLGLAFSLAALTSAGVQRPLYISLDKTAQQILNLANDTLKASSKSTLHTASVQVQVAWTLVGALQSLGPTFIRSHLSQLLLLWKNALPKPLAKETQSSGDKLFLFHVRETALSSIYAFLKHCRPLCTSDVIKRLSTMISNSLAFLQATHVAPPSPVEPKLFNHGPAELEAKLRCRVLACLLEVERMGGTEIEESGVTALAAFADPKIHITSSLGYTSIWDVCDNFAFGISPYCKVPQNIDDMLEVPVFDGIEHDYMHLFVEEHEQEETPPAENCVAEHGIHLFAGLFHKQNAQVQESLLAQMATLLANAQAQRNPGRYTAVQINCLLAIKRTLTTEDIGTVPAKSMSGMTELIVEGLSSSDTYVRRLAAESFGRLATLGGSAMTTSQVNDLVDRIVKDRDPFVRSGCTTALGYIHKFLGGIAAVYHLKSILNVL
ncbi:HEAT repeat protein, partial [Taphrina deformans PYCC 5710]